MVADLLNKSFSENRHSQVDAALRLVIKRPQNVRRSFNIPGLNMHKDFWLQRWESERIGFHQDQVNSYLRKYFQVLHLEHENVVLVPLCGKSVDMQWLCKQSQRVLGVEMSKIAVQAFYKEHGYDPQPVHGEKFESYEANNIRILCGDIFDLNSEDVKQVSAMYDRAALIALPVNMRERYVSHLMSILPSKTQILLITLDYNQDEMTGPPFAVSSDLVVALYSQYAQISLLAKMDVLEQNPRFKERGLSSLHESLFKMTVR